MAHNKAAEKSEIAMRYKKKTDKRDANRDISLRSFFMLTVFVTFCIVVLFSGLIIAGCVVFRHYLLPDANAAYLTVEHALEDGSTTSASYLLTFGEATKLPRIVTEAAGFVTEENSGTLTVETKVTEGPNAVRIDTNEIEFDATYSIQKLESSYDTLTPKRKLAYRFCGAAMVIVPAALSIAGILFCGFYFYKKRLAMPIQLLSEATENIAAQNLDFSLEYACGDEMGALCRSFEMMRAELAENNKAMWNMLEQRRLMQASIAHDLRNPIAIIEGYTEYLQINLPDGKISQEKAGHIVENLNLAAKRLEQYTESVRELNQLEDMEIHKEEISVRKLVEGVREDFKVIAASAGITLQVNYVLKGSSLDKGSFDKVDLDGAGLCESVRGQEAAKGLEMAGKDEENPAKTVKADTVILHRILENIFENATRYAQNTISIDFLLSDYTLQITVTDDGKGFPDEILRKGKKVFLPGGQEGHLGMGLAVSRILCEKHGGSLHFMNAVPHGGMVKLCLSIV